MEYTKEQVLELHAKDITANPFSTVVFSLGLVQMAVNKRMAKESKAFIFLRPSLFTSFGYLDADLNITDAFKKLLDDLTKIHPGWETRENIDAQLLGSLLYGLHRSLKYYKRK